MGKNGVYVPLYAVTPWHHKLIETDSVACWLWLGSLCHCKQQESDGFLVAGVVPLLPLYPRPKPEQLQTYIDQLVKVGLWEVVEGGFRVHDYLDYNLSRDDVKNFSDMRRAAGALGGRERGRREAEAKASASSTRQARASDNDQASAIAKSNLGEERRGEGRRGEDVRTEIAPRSASAQPTAVLLTFPTVGTKGTEWAFTETYRAELAAAYPNLDVLAEVTHARQWVRANPTKRKTPSGMPTFLVNWLNRATSANGGGRSRGPVTGSLKTAGNAAALSSFAQRRKQP